MSSTTKIYENTTNNPMNVVGVGVIAPHGRISITTEFHAPVNMVNYPGLVDVLVEEEKNSAASASAPQAPLQTKPGDQANV